MTEAARPRWKPIVAYRRLWALLLCAGFAWYVVGHVDWGHVRGVHGAFAKIGACFHALLTFLRGEYWDGDRALFLVMAGALQALAVPLGAINTTVTFAVVLATLLRFDPIVPVMTVVPAVALVSFARFEKSFSRPLFTGAMYFFPTLLAAEVYEGLGGNDTWAYNLLRFFQSDWLFARPLSESGAALPYSNLAILVATCGTFFVAKNAMKLGDMALQPGRFDWRAHVSAFGWDGAAFAASSAGGFLIAFAYTNGTFLDVALVFAGILGVVSLLRVYHRARRTTRELASLFEVSRSVSSSLELSATLDRVLDEVRRVFPYDQGAIFLAQREGVLTVAAARGHDVPPEQLSLRVGEGITGHVAQTGQPELVPEISKDPRNFVFHGFLSDSLSGLFVPLNVGGRVAGVMVLGRRGGEPFTKDNLRTLSIFASEAAVSIRNSELYQSIRSGYEKLTALTSISTMINSSLELDRILATVVSSARQLSGAQSAAVLILDEATGEFAARAAEGLRGESHGVHDRKIRPGGMTDYALQTNEVLVVDDLEKETRFHSLYATQEGVRSAVCVPLSIDGAAIGVLFANHYAPRAFQAAEVEILSALAAHVALAVRNAQMYESTFRMAITDPMTKVYNYRYLQQAMRDLIPRHHRFGRTFAVALTDLDHFKQVNDSYGHLEGDRVIREMAAALQHSLRESDILARYAGDEFLVIMPETNRTEAGRAAERMRKSVETRVAAGGKPVTLSIGVAMYPKHGTTPETLVKQADTALYEAKHAGRNRVSLAPGTR